jgi:hypothetical protein
MNAIETKFGVLFMDFIFCLKSSFPKCEVTRLIEKQLQEDPTYMNTIKLDWARYIQPYDIDQYTKAAIQYFNILETKIPQQHVARQLQLRSKYITLHKEKNIDAQETMCSYLRDLQRFALDDSRADNSMDYTVEEPDTPTSDKDDKDNPSRTVKKRTSRFESESLHKLCVQRLGDEQMVLALRQLCINNPVLNNLFRHNTDEEIANALVRLKPVLTIIINAMKQGMPVENLISQFASLITNVDPNASASS